MSSGPARRRGAADPGVAAAQRQVASGAWPVIEMVSWANTATNLDVISALRGDTILVYTPHTQPAWTLPNAHEFELLEPVFDAGLRAAHLICCISPAEILELERRVPGCRTAYLPHGINPVRFRPSRGMRRRQLLMVADFREPRKRADLAFAAMERLARRNPAVSCVIAGRESDHIAAPAALEGQLTRLGFVSDERLVELYQSSAVLLLLSDFEAFGLPIAEALACGLPVVTTDTKEVGSLFRAMPGCYLVRNTDAAEVDRAIDAALDTAPTAGDIAAAAGQAFDLHRTLGQKLHRIEAMVAERFGDNAAAAPVWLT